MKTLQEYAVKMTSLLGDAEKVALARHTFLTIMRKIESEGYTITDDDGDAIVESLIEFFRTESGTHCGMIMLQLLCAIGATPDELSLEVDDDGPLSLNVNVTLN